jgi:hypothetical protein
MRLKLITYGLGNEFDIKKFKPITNTTFIKPRGGLWASQVEASYGWHQWCRENEYGNLETSFEFEFEGNILKIDSYDDARNMTWLPNNAVYSCINSPDFEAIAKQGFDAIWLTEKGETETRFSKPSLYGWDCECVLIINPFGVLLK